MSEPTFYLFPNHQNFQAGKSHLEKAAVYRSHSGWISLALLLALLLFWGAGHFYRISQSEISITAEILSCEVSYGVGATQIEYEFVFDGQSYENTEYLSWFDPSFCSTQKTVEVSLLPTNPQDAVLIGSPDTSQFYFYAIVLGLIGSTILIMVFGSFLQNRKERHKYAQLQKADTILDAEVTNIGFVDAGRNYTYHVADYRFYGQDGTAVLGQIRSRQNFIWPSQIQVGDTLSILYVDDKTYCVL